MATTGEREAWLADFYPSVRTVIKLELLGFST